MRVLIVDDEPLARAFLAEQLGAMAGVEVIGEAANGFEAVKLAEGLAPDLLLLDVQMPRLSGLEVLELLGERAPQVVFVTAHDEFAVRAFEVHAVDYLLKPVEQARLAQAIERAAARLMAPRDRAGSAPTGIASLLAAPRSPDHPLQRVLIREAEHVHVLPVHRIDFIEAQDDYLSFAAGGRRHRKQQTLSQIESQLDRTRFVRIHRSFILNVERIVRIDPYAKDSWQVQLADGTRLPMSRTGYQRLKEVLD